MTVKAWYCNGALMVSEHINDVTQDLINSGPCGVATMAYYGGRYFVCETVYRSAAKIIASAMGWNWSEEPVVWQPEETHQ